ncbi:MAG: VCBS repeat-containing protein [Ignavibacteriae bacterium]|nr:VCBS repeat-containing protein [Ignavibacteriota bacterium]
MARTAIAILLLGLALTAHAAAQAPAPRLAHRLAAPGAAGPAPRAALPDTVRVLALMAEFQPDDDARTSGTGRFNTVFPYDYGADIIDAFPHDRAYFLAHLRFLENYIAKSSGGRTRAVSRLLDSVVTLPKNIRGYSYRKGETEKPVADLAVDAWTAADRVQPAVDFSAYDMFVIFHAGRGRDVDLASLQGSDPTPYDIPSLSFTLGAFRKQLGADFQGIPVNGGKYRITNSSILPSTDSREIPLLTGQTALLELSINGLLAASFGTYAGLPDLFDTRTGRTGIGRFGLMDAESIFAFGGICPPAPSAWEKQYLGWTTPRSAVPGKREYLLSAYRTDQPSTADILRVPVTDAEYWLLENRQRDPGNNGQRVTYVSGGQEVTVSFPKDTTGFTNDNISALKGVVVDVEDLDWSLPGGTVISDTREARVMGGLLIWHIDESVINAGLADNTVNAAPKHRGVDLEQAGGPQDIGETIQSVLGSSVGTGGPLDYWHRDNLSPLYKNSFGAGTTPDTRSADGYFTHVTMDNISTAGPLMSLDVAVGDNVITPMSGWPVDPRDPVDGRRVSFVQTADIDGDGAHEIVVATHAADSTSADPANIYVFEQDGSNYRGGGMPRVAATLTQVSRILEAPAIGDANGDGVLDIVVHASADPAGKMRMLVVVSTRDADNNGALDEVTRHMYAYASEQYQSDLSGWMVRDGSILYRVFHLPAPLSSMIHPDTLFIVGKENRVFPMTQGTVPGSGIAATGDADVIYSGEFLRRSDGTVVASSASPALSARRSLPGVCSVADFDGNGASDGASAAHGLSIDFRNPRWSSTDFSRQMPGGTSPEIADLAAADADGDGRNDLLVSDGSGVTAMNFALSTLDYYPASGGTRYTLAARLAGDTRDALLRVGADALTQLGTRAKAAEGFPVPLPGHTSVLLFPVGSTNPTLGVAVGGTDGLVYLYNTAGRLAPNGLVWRSKDGDETRARYAAPSPYTQTTRSEFFPAERCYNWPNPVYDPVTKVRFYVSENADVTVKIYDLAGAKVGELHSKAAGGVDNEIDWNVSDVQTGVYLAHVKAEGAGRSGEKIIKIAVVK